MNRVSSHVVHLLAVPSCVVPSMKYSEVGRGKTSLEGPKVFNCLVLAGDGLLYKLCQGRLEYRNRNLTYLDEQRCRLPVFLIIR